MFGLERAELRDGDLKIREHLQQERLKLLIRTVDLVDQQDRRLGLGADRAQQRPLEEERVTEDEALLLLRVTRGALLDLDPQHLLWIVPLVEGRVDVEAFVALQADQFSVEGCGQNFGDLGLPDPGLSLDEDWLLQLHGQERRGSDGAVRHIVLPLHHLLNTADTLDHSLLLTRGRPLVVAVPGNFELAKYNNWPDRAGSQCALQCTAGAEAPTTSRLLGQDLGGQQRRHAARSAHFSAPPGAEAPTTSRLLGQDLGGQQRRHAAPGRQWLPAGLDLEQSVGAGHGEQST